MCMNSTSPLHTFSKIPLITVENKKIIEGLDVVAHTSNLSPQEPEAGGSL